MRKFYLKLKSSLVKTAGLLMLLMEIMVPLGALGQETIWSQNFDDCTPSGTAHIANLPTGWSEEATGGNWYIYDGNDGENEIWDLYTPTSTPYTAYVYGWFINAKLVSNAINTEGYSDLKLSFKLLQKEVWGGKNNTEITYRIIEDGEWNYLTTITTTNDDWQTITNITLPDDVYQIGFRPTVPNEDDGAVFVAIDDVIITGEESGVTKYAVNISPSITGGTVTSNKDQASQGSTVTLTANPSTGYTFNNIASNWSVVDGSSNPITVTPTTNNKATFTMPGSAVTVSATFTALTKHNITCNTPTGGTVSTYPTQAYMGDEVEIYAVPTGSSTLTALTATYTDEYSQLHDLGVTPTNTTFTMPNYDVIVNATFLQIGELTVNDGTTPNSYIPIYGYYADAIQENQFILPAAQLAEMSDGTISSMKFYISSPASAAWGCNWNVKVMETAETSVPSLINVSSATLVYNGNIDGTGSTFTITFSTPFTYHGGNLLVDFANTGTGSWKSCEFYGVTAAANSSICTYYSGSYSYPQSWLPKVTFTYTPAPGYSITKVNTNCTISTMVGGEEVTRAEEGETVTLACTPNTHYTFNSWNVHQTDYPYTAVTVTNNSFTMPNYAVTVEAVLDEDQKYEVTYATLEHGYFGDYSETSFYAGSEVNFSVNPNAGYEINTVTVTDADEGNVEVFNNYTNYYYFIIPAKNVTVNATFTEKASNDITINKTGGNELCTVTPNVGNPVYEGTYVTLTVNEPDGYMLTSLSATYNDGEDHDLGVTTTNRSFAMPAYPVTVNAEFAGMLEIGHVAATSKNIVIKMYDTYGDGWNGNYLTLSYNDGTSSENLQLNSGYSAQYTRTLNPGVTMTVSYVKGPGSYTYPSENSFTVEYQGGAMIYQSSGTPYTGMGCNITNPDNSTVWLPIHRDNYYSMSEMIYNHSNYSSLEGGIIVEKISFWTGTNNNSKTYNDVKVYMKTTSYNNFTETDHIAFTNADLVFNGSFTAPASNDAKIDLTLDTPFRLSDINQNIVIGVYSEGNNPGSTYPVKFNSFAAENCGKQWNSWMSNIETYSFEDGSVCNDIPAFGLTYSPIPSHNISYMEATAQGSIGGPATATEGAVVTVYPYASSGYKVDVITVTKADESGTCEVNEDHKFTMPTCDVTVSATFTELQPLSITMPGTQDPNTPTRWLVDGGSIECYNTVEVYEGDNVYLTVYPDGANTVKSLKITDDVTEETVSYNLVYDGGSYISYQFTMPEHNATIALEFNIMVTVFSEDFETGSFTSDKWENEGVWICNYGGYDNIGGNIIPSAPNSGSYNALMYNGTDMKLSTKGVNFADYENLELSFYYVRYAYNSYQEDYNKLRVYYKNTSGSWVLIDDSECALANSWTKKTLDLSDITTSSQFQLAFEGSGSYWGNVTVDDIVVTGTLKPDYTITKADGIINGDITISAATAKHGETVTVTPIPDAGYKVSMISYTDENGWNQYVDMSKTPYTFSMPAANTTVSATFIEIQYCNVITHINGLAITEIAEQSGYYTLPTPSEISGYSFMGWSDADIAEQGTSTYPNIVVYPYQTTCQVPASATYELYAVYAKEGNSFKMVTSTTTFNDGDKFIAVTPQDGNYYYALSYDSWNDSKVYLSEWNYISSDGVITDGFNAFTLSGNSTDGFIIVKDGKHMSPNGTEYSSRYYMIEGEAQTQDLFEFTMGSSGYKISSVIGGTEYSLYQDGTDIIPMNGGWATEFRILKEQQGGGYPIDEYYTYVEAPVSGEITITGDVTITNPFIIGPTAVVTVTGMLTNTDANKLIIQDGGELILAQGNTGVMATVEKNIEAITSSKGDGYTVDKWYTIGSSVYAPYINSNGETNHVENMIPVGGVDDLSYNLYYLDMTKELPWINYRQGNGVTGFNQLENGRGYLYSNQAATTVEYVGELNTENVNRDVNEGWNLISNPFAQTIAFSGFALNSGSMAGYYTLDGAGGWKTTMSTADVKNNQGILINVPEEASSVTISRPENDGAKRGESRDEEYAYVEINVSNANYSDRTYAAYTEANCLPKYNHQNAKIQKVYIPQGDGEVAIACMEKSTTLFPVNFKAMTTGEYTINLNATEDINYLVLVDNMTGEEIDMLIEDSYSFIGSTSDNERRFTVKLGFSQDLDSEGNSNFVYQNGNELIINGEGTIQIIDLLGRVIVSKEVHGGTVSVGNLITGAYIVRMIGNEVKTQKIVIK